MSPMFMVRHFTPSMHNAMRTFIKVGMAATGKIPIEFASGLSDPADVQWVQCTRPGCFKHRKLPASVFTPKPFECIKNR